MTKCSFDPQSIRKVNEIMKNGDGIGKEKSLSMYLM